MRTGYPRQKVSFKTRGSHGKLNPLVGLKKGSARSNRMSPFQPSLQGKPTASAQFINYRLMSCRSRILLFFMNTLAETSVSFAN